MPDNIPLFNVYHGFTRNLALQSLAGNLDVKGTEVKILDLIFFCKGIRKILKKALDAYKPHLVGLTSMTFQYSTARKVAQFIRSYDKNIKVVLGGYHATLTYDELVTGQDKDLFDFIVRGEGEETFKELVQNLHLGNPCFENVLGLSFRNNGTFIHNAPRPLQDLDTLKIPKRHGLDLFKSNHGTFGRLETIESTRGCTYGCNFCSIHHMYGFSYRRFKTERVIEDIRQARECGAVRIMFADDNITLDVKNLKKLCDAIVENGLTDIWYSTQASVRGIASDEELVKKMRAANFAGSFLGIESPIKRNLEKLNKTDIVEESKRAVAYMRKYDMVVLGGFITANPDDTKEDIDAVFKFSRKIGCDTLMLQILTPYPKTKVREMLAQANMITNDIDQSKYNGFWANVRTKHLSSRQIMWRVSLGNVLWYLQELFNRNNWWNKSKRILPQIRRKVWWRTWGLILQFCLGRYGKSTHRF